MNEDFKQPDKADGVEEFNSTSLRNRLIMIGKIGILPV